MSIADALAWYGSALDGEMKVPGLMRDVSIASTPFLPEPALGRLLISNDLPFALTWHGGLRIHCLVPAEDLPEPISGLSLAKESEKQTNMRGWLMDRIGFDLLAYDDFLGGVVLLAPNPVARGVSTYIKESLADGSERLGVKVNLREGVDVNTLRVRVREERPGGTSILESRLDQFAMTEFVVPEQTYRLGLELVCDKRGVLSIQTPAHFFRSVHVSAQQTIHQGEVDVPARKKGAPPKTNRLMTVRRDPGRKPLPPARVISGALRMSTLQTRREARTGYRRPDGYFQSADQNERIFLDNRLEAVSFIQGLVRHAHQRVVFVDRYFDEIDLRDFALVTLYEEVTVSVLTGHGVNLCRTKTDSENNNLNTGDVFAADLEKLNADLQAMGRTAPSVLLMGRPARTYHDRFLVVDDVVWHFGHSFNQSGSSEVSMANRLLHPEDIRTLILEDIANASPFLTTWPVLKIQRQAEQTGTTDEPPSS
jgi:hypothetical protein